MKGILLFIAIVICHGCSLSSDQEMEQRLTNHWKQMQELNHE